MPDPSQTIWRPTPPDWHPGAATGAATCTPGSCRGVWREVTGHGTKERGWRWQCDHLRCPLAQRQAANG